MEEQRMSILGAGNPLLDVLANVTDDFLKKYDLQPDNAILATEKHDNLCNDMIQSFQVQYIAGGAAQNSIRVAQWFFQKPEVCGFFGCIGDDQFGRQMKEKAVEDKINVMYMIDKTTPTGTCACLITKQGKCRSLCAYLGASQKFDIKHIHDNMEAVKSARIIYITAYYMIVSLDSALFLAKHVHDTLNKTFAFNLSAQYISQFYSDKLLQILPYVDLLFGNETEAQAFAESQDLKTTELDVIAQKLADWKHLRPRTVIITHGKNEVIVAYTGSRKPVEKYPVPHLDDDIVDTTGAGDSFVGGFLAYRLAGKSMSDCIKAGTYAAQEVIKQSGCIFPKENKMKLA